MVEITDAMRQSADWKGRLLLSLLNPDFDPPTKATLLKAAMDRAHIEGLESAAGMCRQVAAGLTGERRRIVDVIATAIDEHTAFCRVEEQEAAHG